MRALLMQTTTKDRDDAQLDRAANDAQFGATQSGIARVGAMPVALDAATPITAAGAPSDNDDDWLGGYAGI